MILLVLVIFLASAPVYIRNEYYIHVLIMMFINILIASGLRLIMTTGLVPFCHAAFIAIGGYTSSLLVMEAGFNSWIALLISLATSALIAVSFGFVLLRLKGAYFFMATAAFGEIVLLIFTRWTKPFGGPAGLIDIPAPSGINIPGIVSIVFISKTSFYYLVLILTLFAMVIAYRIDRSRLGDIWTGISQTEELAEAVGVSTMLYKTIAFALGSCMAALGGVLEAHYLTHINPSQFGFFALVNYLVYVIAGGQRSFIGPILGTAILMILSEILGMYESLAYYQVLIYGIVLVLVVLFLPEGFVSIAEKLSASWVSKPQTE